MDETDDWDTSSSLPIAAISLKSVSQMERSILLADNKENKPFSSKSPLLIPKEEFKPSNPKSSPGLASGVPSLDGLAGAVAATHDEVDGKEDGFVRNSPPFICRRFSSVVTSVGGVVESDGLAGVVAATQDEVDGKEDGFVGNSPPFICRRFSSVVASVGVVQSDGPAGAIATNHDEVDGNEDGFVRNSPPFVRKERVSSSVVDVASVIVPVVEESNGPRAVAASHKVDVRAGEFVKDSVPYNQEDVVHSGSVVRPSLSVEGRFFKMDGPAAVRQVDVDEFVRTSSPLNLDLVQSSLTYAQIQASRNVLHDGGPLWVVQSSCGGNGPTAHVDVMETNKSDGGLSSVVQPRSTQNGIDEILWHESKNGLPMDAPLSNCVIQSRQTALDLPRRFSIQLDSRLMELGASVVQAGSRSLGNGDVQNFLALPIVTSTRDDFSTLPSRSSSEVHVDSRLLDSTNGSGSSPFLSMTHGEMGLNVGQSTREEKRLVKKDPTVLPRGSVRVVSSAVSLGIRPLQATSSSSVAFSPVPIREGSSFQSHASLAAAATTSTIFEGPSWIAATPTFGAAASLSSIPSPSTPMMSFIGSSSAALMTTTTTTTPGARLVRACTLKREISGDERTAFVIFATRALEELDPISPDFARALEQACDLENPVFHEFDEESKLNWTTLKIGNACDAVRADSSTFAYGTVKEIIQNVDDFSIDTCRTIIRISFQQFADDRFFFLPRQEHLLAKAKTKSKRTAKIELRLGDACDVKVETERGFLEWIRASVSGRLDERNKGTMYKILIFTKHGIEKEISIPADSPHLAVSGTRAGVKPRFGPSLADDTVLSSLSVFVDNTTTHPLIAKLAMVFAVNGLSEKCLDVLETESAERANHQPDETDLSFAVALAMRSGLFGEKEQPSEKMFCSRLIAALEQRTRIHRMELVANCVRVFMIRSKAFSEWEIANQIERWGLLTAEMYLNASSATSSDYADDERVRLLRERGFKIVSTAFEKLCGASISSSTTYTLPLPRPANQYAMSKEDLVAWSTRVRVVDIALRYRPVSQLKLGPIFAHTPLTPTQAREVIVTLGHKDLIPFLSWPVLSEMLKLKSADADLLFACCEFRGDAAELAKKYPQEFCEWLRRFYAANGASIATRKLAFSLATQADVESAALALLKHCMMIRDAQLARDVVVPLLGSKIPIFATEAMDESPKTLLIKSAVECATSESFSAMLSVLLGLAERGKAIGAESILDLNDLKTLFDFATVDASFLAVFVGFLMECSASLGRGDRMPRYILSPPVLRAFVEKLMHPEIVDFLILQLYTQAELGAFSAKDSLKLQFVFQQYFSGGFVSPEPRVRDLLVATAFRARNMSYALRSWELAARTLAQDHQQADDYENPCVFRLFKLLEALVNQGALATGMGTVRSHVTNLLPNNEDNIHIEVIRGSLNAPPSGCEVFPESAVNDVDFFLPFGSTLRDVKIALAHTHKFKNCASSRSFVLTSSVQNLLVPLSDRFDWVSNGENDSASIAYLAEPSVEIDKRLKIKLRVCFAAYRALPVRPVRLLMNGELSPGFVSALNMLKSDPDLRMSSPTWISSITRKAKENPDTLFRDLDSFGFDWRDFSRSTESEALNDTFRLEIFKSSVVYDFLKRLISHPAGQETELSARALNLLMVLPTWPTTTLSHSSGKYGEDTRFGARLMYEIDAMNVYRDGKGNSATVTTIAAAGFNDTVELWYELAGEFLDSNDSLLTGDARMKEIASHIASQLVHDFPKVFEDERDKSRFDRATETIARVGEKALKWFLNGYLFEPGMDLFDRCLSSRPTLRVFSDALHCKDVVIAWSASREALDDAHFDRFIESLSRAYTLSKQLKSGYNLRASIEKAVVDGTKFFGDVQSRLEQKVRFVNFISVTLAPTAHDPRARDVNESFADSNDSFVLPNQTIIAETALELVGCGYSSAVSCLDQYMSGLRQPSVARAFEALEKLACKLPRADPAWEALVSPTMEKLIWKNDGKLLESLVYRESWRDLHKSSDRHVAKFRAPESHCCYVSPSPVHSALMHQLFGGFGDSRAIEVMGNAKSRAHLVNIPKMKEELNFLRHSVRASRNVDGDSIFLTEKAVVDSIHSSFHESVRESCDRCGHVASTERERQDLDCMKLSMSSFPEMFTKDSQLARLSLATCAACKSTGTTRVSRRIVSSPKCGAAMILFQGTCEGDSIIDKTSISLDPFQLSTSPNVANEKWIVSGAWYDEPEHNAIYSCVKDDASDGWLEFECLENATTCTRYLDEYALLDKFRANSFTLRGVTIHRVDNFTSFPVISIDPMVDADNLKFTFAQRLRSEAFRDMVVRLVGMTAVRVSSSLNTSSGSVLNTSTSGVGQQHHRASTTITPTRSSIKPPDWFPPTAVRVSPALLRRPALSTSPAAPHHSFVFNTSASLGAHDVALLSAACSYAFLVCENDSLFHPVYAAIKEIASNGYKEWFEKFSENDWNALCDLTKLSINASSLLAYLHAAASVAKGMTDSTELCAWFFNRQCFTVCEGLISQANVAGAASRLLARPGLLSGCLDDPHALGLGACLMERSLPDVRVRECRGREERLVLFLLEETPQALRWLAWWPAKERLVLELLKKFGTVGWTRVGLELLNSLSLNLIEQVGFCEIQLLRRLFDLRESKKQRDNVFNGIRWVVDRCQTSDRTVKSLAFLESEHPEQEDRATDWACRFLETHVRSLWDKKRKSAVPHNRSVSAIVGDDDEDESRPRNASRDAVSVAKTVFEAWLALEERMDKACGRTEWLVPRPPNEVLVRLARATVFQEDRDAGCVVTLLEDTKCLYIVGANEKPDPVELVLTLIRSGTENFIFPAEIGMNRHEFRRKLVPGERALFFESTRAQHDILDWGVCEFEWMVMPSSPIKPVGEQFSRVEAFSFQKGDESVLGSGVKREQSFAEQQQRSRVLGDSDFVSPAKKSPSKFKPSPSHLPPADQFGEWVEDGDDPFAF